MVTVESPHPMLTLISYGGVQNSARTNSPDQVYAHMRVWLTFLNRFFLLSFSVSLSLEGASNPVATVFFF